jgi:hypothetical protein
MLQGAGNFISKMKKTMAVDTMKLMTHFYNIC